MRQLRVKAIIIEQPGKVVYQTLQIPIEPSSIVVKVERVGICTPEQRVYRGTRRIYPYWGGHEVSGRVEAILAPSTSELAIGDHVIVGLMDRCGVCETCRRGLDNHCAYLHPASEEGLPKGPRGFSDQLVAPPYKIFRVASNLPWERAALVEPIACVLHSVRAAVLRPGDRTLVIGAGTMGLLHAIVLQHLGYEVALVEREPSAVAQARRLGPLAIYDPAAFLASKTLDAFGARGPQAVFCTRFGVPAVEAAARIIARGGRIVLYQTLEPAAQLSIDLNGLHYREACLVGTLAHTVNDLTVAAELVSSLATELDVLTIETAPASQAQAAFERAINVKVNRMMIDCAAFPPI